MMPVDSDALTSAAVRLRGARTACLGSLERVTRPIAENELGWRQNPTFLSIVAHDRIGRLLFVGDYHRRADRSTML